MMVRAAIDRPAVNPPREESWRGTDATTTRRACSTSRAGLWPAAGGAGFLTRLKGSFMADKGSLSRIASPPSCGAAVVAFTGQS